MRVNGRSDLVIEKFSHRARWRMHLVGDLQNVPSCQILERLEVVRVRCVELVAVEVNTGQCDSRLDVLLVVRCIINKVEGVAWVVAEVVRLLVWEV